MNQSSLCKEIKEQAKYFLYNPIYMVTLLLAAVLGYGYVLTHGTCGIDDISIDLYFEKGIGVAIGRWPYYLVNKLIPITPYKPFIGDFVTVLLLMVSAIICCVLIHMVIKRDITIWAYVVFSVFFLDYSMNAEVFVFYLQNGIGWVYLFSAFSLICFYYLFSNQVVWKQQIIIRVALIFMLTIAISFYESAANIVLTGSFMVIFVNRFLEKENAVFTKMQYMKAFFFIARYIIYAMIARRMIRTILMRVFSIPAYIFYRSAANFEWLTRGGIRGAILAIQNIVAQIYRDYFAMAVVYYPILLFVICSFLFFVILLYCTKKNRDGILFLTGLGLYASMFALCFIEGNVMLYRACMVFHIFVSAVFMVVVLVCQHSRVWVKRGLSVAIALAILLSIADLTRWFVLDYDKTEYEMRVIDDIAEELHSGKYDLTKPLVVVGAFELPDDLYDKYCIKEGEFGWQIVKKAAERTKVKVGDKYCYAQNSNSILNWAVHAFGVSCGYNVPMKQFFEYRGYQLHWADNETIKRVFSEYFPMDWEYYSYTNITLFTEQYGKDEQYPNENYIEELEDCLVIKL